MACGKTTLGRAVAACADISFIDLDEAVEQAAGMTVSEIFATMGEDTFRHMESETLASLAAARPGRRMLVACGGGTPCHGRNMELMLASGTVVWLDACRDITLRRLEEAMSTRPLVAGKTRDELETFVDANLAARMPFYSRAHLRFDSSRLDTPGEIADTTARFLQLLRLPPVPSSQFLIPNS